MIGWYFLIGVIQVTALDVCGVKAYSRPYWILLVMTAVCCNIAIHANRGKK